MKVAVCKEFKFSYGHYLPGHTKCFQQHGHNGKLIVKVSGTIDKGGMVIDFSSLNEIVEREVIQIVDHRNLNDIIEFPQPPTIENMGIWTFNKLKYQFSKFNEKYKRDIKLEEVVLFETDDSYTVINGVM